MQFGYKGRTADGTLTEGVVTAQTKFEALQILEQRSLTVLTISPKRAARLHTTITFLSRVKLSEKIMFAKNIAGMLRAGLPLSRALEVLQKQVTNPYFKTILTELLATIDKGGTLSEGLAKYPNVFSMLVVAMVRAGEESGTLPAALMEITGNLEKTYALNQKIKSALMYPSIIISAIILIGVLMFIYVVPTLTKTFKELNADLPASTKVVIAISDALSNHYLLIIVGVIGVSIALALLLRTASVRRLRDRLIVRVPVLGVLVREVNAARTTRTLSSLLSSGVGISRAVSITREVLQNSQYKAVLIEIEAAIERGEPMSSIFSKYPHLYPVMVGEMVQVGEETGKLADMLSDIASFYEAEVDAKTKNLSTIIEPVLMIVIGAAVGFFAVSMLSPMYSIMDSIK